MDKIQEKAINQKGRATALQLEQLMARVDFKYNRHQPCLVCNEKYKHHIDGLPCVSDTERKQIIRTDRWGNILTRG
jgi:hypothetical protein|tara:strand:+ start:1718 stop:1945 length:228 start_codon:yes stop_codon:yes gene_type:complete